MPPDEVTQQEGKGDEQPGEPRTADVAQAEEASPGAPREEDEERQEGADEERSAEAPTEAVEQGADASTGTPDEEVGLADGTATTQASAGKTEGADAAKEATPKQGTGKKQRKWFFTIAPYALFPFIAGDVELGDLSVDVNADAGDVIKALDWALPLYFEATHPQWAILGDITYMDLGRKGEATVGPTDAPANAEADIKQLFAQVHGFRRAASWVEVGLGVRLVHQEVGLSARVQSNVMIPDVDEQRSLTWVDPLLAVRLNVPFKNKWRLGALLDFGGFHAGSDYTWQAHGYAGYLFHPVFELAVGFRSLALRYVKGSGSDRYVMDANFFGPELGFVFHI